MRVHAIEPEDHQLLGEARRGTASATGARDRDRRNRGRERDWRKRKDQLDAMAAALILQDFLDSRPRP
jgi:RNase H-fold protein (predicted Holliday junction resolvase)